MELVKHYLRYYADTKMEIWYQLAMAALEAANFQVYRELRG